MLNYITEDDIEQAILDKLRAEPFNYDIIICDADTSKRDDLNDGTGRTSKKQCVLLQRLKESLGRINPNMLERIADSIANDLLRNYTGSDIFKNLEQEIE